tara:strand:- start:5229 stop:5510 length:282 start_codon:yes stop_codon:yes gene_type:complete
MNKTQYKPSSTTLSKGNAYIDNSIFMEFVDDIATQMTEIAYKGKATIEIQDGLSDDTCIVFTEEAQDFYNERYDEIETMLNNTLRVYSDECLR